jgi:hypothetical protein
MGPQGPVGLQGLTGSQGAQGIQGAKGDKGDIGPQGPKGDTGAQGIKGLKGDTGPQGIQGVAGPAGASIDITKAYIVMSGPKLAPAAFCNLGDLLLTSACSYSDSGNEWVFESRMSIGHDPGTGVPIFNYGCDFADFLGNGKKGTVSLLCLKLN